MPFYFFIMLPYWMRDAFLQGCYDHRDTKTPKDSSEL